MQVKYHAYAGRSQNGSVDNSAVFTQRSGPFCFKTAVRGLAFVEILLYNSLTYPQRSGSDIRVSFDVERR